MGLFKLFESCLNCFFVLMIVFFVFGVLSFADKETYGLSAIGNLFETSFVVGYQLCEVTKLCDTDPTRVANGVVNAISDRYNRAVVNGGKQVRRQRDKRNKREKEETTKQSKINKVLSVKNKVYA